MLRSSLILLHLQKQLSNPPEISLSVFSILRGKIALVSFSVQSLIFGNRKRSFPSLVALARTIRSSIRAERLTLACGPITLLNQNGSIIVCGDDWVPERESSLNCCPSTVQNTNRNGATSAYQRIRNGATSAGLSARSRFEVKEKRHVETRRKGRKEGIVGSGHGRRR
eukprot:scaffold62702_cov38-Cyclotella_meneghiniana.AAC.2